MKKWFAGALGSQIKGEKRKCIPRWKTTIVNFTSEPSQPLFICPLHFLFFDNSPKERGKLFWPIQLFYCRFLSNRNSTAPTTMIATIMPITAGTKYVSANEAGIGVGDGVACGASLA
jgi:hypothetical protein